MYLRSYFYGTGSHNWFLWCDITILINYLFYVVFNIIIFILLFILLFLPVLLKPQYTIETLPRIVLCQLLFQWTPAKEQIYLVSQKRAANNYYPSSYHWIKECVVTMPPITRHHIEKNFPLKWTSYREYFIILISPKFCHTHLAQFLQIYPIHIITVPLTGCSCPRLEMPTVI